MNPLIAEIKELKAAINTIETELSTVKKGIDIRDLFLSQVATPQESAPAADAQADAKKHLESLQLNYKTKKTLLESKMREPAEELWETLKAVNQEITDLLNRPDLRSDHDIRAAAISDSIENLMDAQALSEFIRDLCSEPVAPAPPTPNPAEYERPAEETGFRAARPLATTKSVADLEAEIPGELSQFQASSRTGDNLKRFGATYRTQLQQLFDAYGRAPGTLTSFLKNRGLNSTGPLSESQVIGLLKGLGLSLKREPGVQKEEGAVTALTNLTCTLAGVQGRGELNDEGFILKANSVGQLEAKASLPESLASLKKNLIAEGLARIFQGKLVMTKDYVFSSPSAAASFLTGTSMNGLDAWQTEKGETLNNLKKQGRL